MARKPALFQPGLRARAEDVLLRTAEDIRSMSDRGVQELVYELQVHQVELEMQNEELRIAQRELEASRDKYHDLYNFAPVGHMTLNNEGVILEANAMLTRQLGVSREQLIGKNFTKFVKSTFQDAYYFHIRKVFHSGLQETCELELIRRADSLPYIVQLHSIAAADKKGCRIALNDITTLKNLQAELTLARDQAQSANRVKSQFLANMSHEIRTPLSAIMGLGDILMKSSPLTSRQKDYIRTLRVSSDSLLALINELLDITRIEAGKIELERIPFDLYRMLDDALQLMSVKAQEKGIALTIKGAPGHTNYYGDPHRIYQIVLNLLGNAIKFTEKGEVVLQVETEAETAPWRKIVIGVQDTGIGIPEEKIVSIFDTFTQADASTSRKYGGTGLGLAICRKLAEQMKGTINARSRLGTGSLFTFSLPLEESFEAPELQKFAMDAVETEASLLSLPFSRTSGNRHRILLVEDNPNNILIATTLLDEFGYDYDVATTGKDAFEKIRGVDYALVLLDIHMQDMDGFQVIRLIRQREKDDKLGHSCVIAMTACAMRGDREKCLHAGMDDYIAKPFRSSELQDTLEQYIPAAAS